MTKVGQLFEEEKIEYAKEYAKEYAREEKIRLFCDMIDAGELTEEIAAKNLHCSIEEFKKMRNVLLQHASFIKST